MRRIHVLLIFIVCALTASAQLAPTVQVTWQFQNYVGTNATVSRVSLTPLPPFQVINGIYAVPEKINFLPALTPSITNGSVTTNVQVGTLYQLSISGPFGVLLKTNFFPLALTNSAGPFNGATYDVAGYQTFNNVLVGVYFTGTNFISAGSAVAQGTNIVTTTNSGATTVNLAQNVQLSGGVTAGDGFTNQNTGTSDILETNTVTGSFAKLTRNGNLHGSGTNFINYSSVTNNEGVGGTNFDGEIVITNGVTLGGVRITSWPVGAGPFNVSQFITVAGLTNLATNQSFQGLIINSNVIASNAFAGLLTITNDATANRYFGNGSNLTGIGTIGGNAEQAVATTFTNLATPLTNIPFGNVSSNWSVALTNNAGWVNVSNGLILQATATNNITNHLAVADPTHLGGVKPDNVTITAASDGTISSSGSTGPFSLQSTNYFGTVANNTNLSFPNGQGFQLITNTAAGLSTGNTIQWAQTGDNYTNTLRVDWTSGYTNYTLLALIKYPTLPSATVGGILVTNAANPALASYPWVSINAQDIAGNQHFPYSDRLFSPTNVDYGFAQGTAVNTGFWAIRQEWHQK